ncbi:hypothetical protein V2J09_020051 [Rumex salicifolius]
MTSWYEHLICWKSSSLAYESDEEVPGLKNIKLYKYKELRAATKNFSKGNKIGQGGFGSVYEGKLRDGKFAAIKVLSADSNQGVDEFLTEIKAIADIQHRNLVKLYGCCVEDDHRILVYNYMENNSLAQTLLGYLAPEYAVRGRLTRKADIYSFGVLLAEIVTGRPNINSRLPTGERFILERAWGYYEQNKLPLLVDDTLNGNYNVDEACNFLKIALLCTQDNPKLRPSMSTAVKMLSGEIDISNKSIQKPGLISDLSQVKVGNDPNEGTSGEKVHLKSANSTGEYTISSSSENMDGSCPNSGLFSSSMPSTCAPISFSSHDRSM